jgi:AraC family transcriptional regulator, positive regulator of tynA and feaB
MAGDLLHSISAAHQYFTSPDKWRATLAPHFSGARYTPRRSSFSIHGRLEKLAGISLIDILVARSGLEGVAGAYGFSIKAIDTHPCFIVWQQAGVARIRQNNCDTELRGGEWALFDARRPTSFLVPDNSRTIGMMLPHSHYDWTRNARSGGVRLHTLLETRIAAAVLLEALASAEWIRLPLQSALETFLIGVVEACLPLDAAQGPNHPTCLTLKLDRARQAIEANLANVQLRPEDIGKAIGLSRRSLYRMFSQLGKTPMEYVYELRLAEAARRLRRRGGDYRGITGLALDVGFADSSHFSRSFRSRYGMSPKQWAAAS